MTYTRRAVVFALLVALATSMLWTGYQARQSQTMTQLVSASAPEVGQTVTVEIPLSWWNQLRCGPDAWVDHPAPFTAAEIAHYYEWGTAATDGGCSHYPGRVFTAVYQGGGAYSWAGGWYGKLDPAWIR